MGNELGNNMGVIQKMGNIGRSTHYVLVRKLAIKRTKQAIWLPGRQKGR
jgi:hypothetical protein